MAKVKESTELCLQRMQHLVFGAFLNGDMLDTSLRGHFYLNNVELASNSSDLLVATTHGDEAITVAAPAEEAMIDVAKVSCACGGLEMKISDAMPI